MTMGWLKTLPLFKSIGKKNYYVRCTCTVTALFVSVQKKKPLLFGFEVKPTSAVCSVSAAHLQQQRLTLTRRLSALTERLIDWRSIRKDFQSWQRQCRPLAPVYLCGAAGPQRDAWRNEKVLMGRRGWKTVFVSDLWAPAQNIPYSANLLPLYWISSWRQISI